MFRRIPIVVLAGLLAQPALAAQTVPLPAWVCAHPDAIFVSELDTAEIPVPHDPGDGTGCDRHNHSHAARRRTRHRHETYYLYVPKPYVASQPYPFLLALHGTAPYDQRDNYAGDVLSAWSAIAAGAKIIVAAPVADLAVTVNGEVGATWSVPPDDPSDYDLFAAALADVESHYNIDRTRICGWGFSSGGSVMHALGLTSVSAAFNNATMAGYAAAAGALAGDLCEGESARVATALEAAPRKIPVSLVVGTSDPRKAMCRRLQPVGHGRLDREHERFHEHLRRRPCLFRDQSAAGLEPPLSQRGDALSLFDSFTLVAAVLSRPL